jgi:hypothetical protein
MALSRRGFLGTLLGGIAAAVVAPKVLADPEREVWVPGARTIVLPPPGGWVTSEALEPYVKRWRRTLKIELFPNAGKTTGLLADGSMNGLRPVLVAGRLMRFTEVNFDRGEPKMLFGAYQHPIAVGCGAARLTATLEEVHLPEGVAVQPTAASILDPDSYHVLEETADARYGGPYQIITSYGVHLPDEPTDALMHEGYNYAYERESLQDYHDRMGFERDDA